MKLETEKSIHRNINMRILAAVFAFVFFFITLPAQADLILEFDPATTDILVGQTVLVDIILTQTDNGDLVPGGDIRLGADGLFEAGMGFSSTMPTVASSAFVTPGIGFIDSIITPSTSTELYVSSEDALVATFAPNTNPTSLTLGTYSFTGLDVGSTTINFLDPSVFDDWVFGNDVGGSDAAVFADAGSLTLNVSAVPEPSSFALVLIGSALAGMIRVRQRASKGTA